MSEVNPLNVLIEELRSDDTQYKLEAIRKLDVIAKALGPERTRIELLQYLAGTLPPPLSLSLFEILFSLSLSLTHSLTHTHTLSLSVFLSLTFSLSLLDI